MNSKAFATFANVLLVLVLMSGACAPQATRISTDTPVPATATETVTPLPASSPTMAGPTPTPTLVPESDFIKGITLNYSGNGPKLGTAGAQEVIQRYIVPSGANYVALIPTCWSENMRDTKINCSTKRVEGGVPQVSDSQLIQSIKYLHSIGLRVVLKPQALVKTVHVTESEKKQRSWDRTHEREWFDSYIGFILRYARIAEAEQVDLFVVGNEQEDNTGNAEEWRRVIAAVREVYHGPITYAANAWSFEAYGVTFWDALDYIGTNAYQFGFLDKEQPTIDDRLQAWKPYVTKLEELSEQYGKPVIITEIGAMSMQGFHKGITNPPHWTATTYDAQEQADYYTAFFEALKDQPWLKGILLWQIDTELLQGGPYDLGDSFINKPAEGIVRQYFDGAPLVAEAPPEFTEDPAHSRVIYDEGLARSWMPWFEPDASVIADLKSPNGHNSPLAIRLPLSRYRGIGIDNGLAAVDMSKYKWIEFYILTGKRPPRSLVVQFEYWTPELFYHSWRARVDEPEYIEGGAFQPGVWQRVRIPLVDLGITDQRFTGFGIQNCSWPCSLDRAVDDVYIDDIRFIAGTLADAAATELTVTPEFIEDPAQSLMIYSDQLENAWQMWTDEGGMTLSQLDYAPGYQSSHAIRIQLSTIGGLSLYGGYLDMSTYKWLEFYIMVGERTPNNLVVRFEDWGPGAPAYFGALVDDPSYIEGGQFQPGTWQRVRIPLADMGYTDQIIYNTSSFNMRNCFSWPCEADSIADDIYIDNIRLIAGN